MFTSSVPVGTLAAVPAARGLLATPLGKLLVALIAITVIVLVGRFVLSVAWRLLVVATIIVAVVWVLSTVLGGF